MHMLPINDVPIYDTNHISHFCQNPVSVWSDVQLRMFMVTVAGETKIHPSLRDRCHAAEMSYG